MPTLNTHYAGKTVVAVGAHPDDLELGLGGTIARLSKGGARVVMVIGYIPDNFDTRLEEARKSAAILGAEVRVLLNEGPARVEDAKTYELVRRMDLLMKELKPTALFTHGKKDFHNDHVLMHNVSLSSQRLRALDFYCYHPTTCRPAPMSFQPQAFVDITETIQTKMEAINAHPSQFSGRGLNPDFLVDVARALGRMAGVQYAEGLEIMHMMI